MKLEDIETTKNARIQILIREATPQGNFHSAIYYTVAEWLALEWSEIEKQIRGRVNNWIDIVTHPPVPVEPTKEELIELKAELERQDAELEARIADVTSQIAAKG